MKLNQPIVGMAPTPTGSGYWLVAADGGIFTFGDARFHGPTGAMKLNQPIVGMAPTPTGSGYWLVAADAAIFPFGEARFRGSSSGPRRPNPIVAIPAAATGRGYRRVREARRIHRRAQRPEANKCVRTSRDQ